MPAAISNYNKKTENQEDEVAENGRWEKGIHSPRRLDFNTPTLSKWIRGL